MNYWNNEYLPIKTIQNNNSTYLFISVKKEIQLGEWFDKTKIIKSVCMFISISFGDNDKMMWGI